MMNYEKGLSMTNYAGLAFFQIIGYSLKA